MTPRVHTPHRDTAWMERAACAGHDPELFFPEPPGDRSDEARSVCRGCPVRLDCLFAALKLPNDGGYGIWGGSTRRERIKLIRWDREARA